MMKDKQIETKFGRASLNRDGYYIIKRGDKQYRGKLLHRLIFEDFYGITLDEKYPNGVHIHHIDEDRVNNEITNLIALSPSEHQRLHQKGENNHRYGKCCSEDLRKKISKVRTGTGFFRVYKKKNKIYSQGFQWTYHYYKDGAKRQTHITSVDLLNLKRKVLEKGLDWFIIDWDIAESTCSQYGYVLEEVC